MYARWVLLQVLLRQKAPPALLRGTLLWFDQLVLLLSRHQYLSQTLFWRQHSVSWPSESSLRAFLVTHSEHLTLSDFARLLHAACLDRYDEITARQVEGLSSVCCCRLPTPESAFSWLRDFVATAGSAAGQLLECWAAFLLSGSGSLSCSKAIHCTVTVGGSTVTDRGAPDMHVSVLQAARSD